DAGAQPQAPDAEVAGVAPAEHEAGQPRTAVGRRDPGDQRLEDLAIDCLRGGGRRAQRVEAARLRGDRLAELATAPGVENVAAGEAGRAALPAAGAESRQQDRDEDAAKPAPH